MKPLLFLALLFLSLTVNATQSTCFGSTKNGYLKNGVKLPAKGKNFTNYSNVARLAGRTYVHSAVNSIIVSAFKDLEKDQPDKVYKYAETGFESGGEFKPHKTHRNGLSVDFMVPVTNKQGMSTHLPTHVKNKFGYNIEFDANSQFKHYKIDYEAMAAHITALDKQAKKQGHGIWRVIFDPKLQHNLYKTKYSNYLKRNIQFSTKRAWVRHDEHYHVDFSVKCAALDK